MHEFFHLELDKDFEDVKEEMIENANGYAVEAMEAEVKVLEDGAMSVSAGNFPFKEVRNFGKG